MSVSYHKVKAVPKLVSTNRSGLGKKVLSTMETISEIVGSTLGPGGRPVLIERQEYGLPNVITKDGVTVFRSLGFEDSTSHCIMEAARDASVRTATEAGDGTTTATVLAYAIMKKTAEMCTENPTLSPQRVTRDINKFFKDVIEPTIQGMSTSISIEDRDTLVKIAKLSANGDEVLAQKVLECFDLVGDAGNVTIVEESGPSGYEVERIEGYPISTGYEDSCDRYYPSFINEQGTASVKMDKPLFILNYGKITDIHSLFPLFAILNDSDVSNVVVVATGFSDQVLGHLAMNFSQGGTLKVYPLIVPMSPSPTGQLDFIEDLAAITGGKVLSNLGKTLANATEKDLGFLPNGSFEATRYRSNVIGIRDEILVIERVDVLQKRLAVAGSKLDATILQERIGKVSGGIAKLRVIGPSTGDVKERRDRADDAVCAVRGALKHGYLSGGGKTLVKLATTLEFPSKHVCDVLGPAFIEPVRRMLNNAGLDDDAAKAVVKKLADEPTKVFDALEMEYVEPLEGGILDSTPAVLEAIRNSIAIATVLGTLGGAVVFPRDKEFERAEAKEAHDYLRNAGEEHPAS
jgi:chaperonin GroEL